MRSFITSFQWKAWKLIMCPKPWCNYFIIMILCVLALISNPTLIFIDANRKWDLRYESAGCAIWVNVIVSVKCRIICAMHLLLKQSTLFVTLIFDDFCIIAKNKRQSRYRCIHLVNCLLVGYVSLCAEICRCDTACPPCWYSFRSRWDYCQDT